MAVLDQSINIYRYFEKISSIPHGSFNEKALADYIVSFAVDHELSCYRDESNNVVIYKSGSRGREKELPLMLQCHMDMVCEKNSDCDHDFIKNPLKLQLNNGWLSGKGTTLGGDNGTGVSYILSILSDNSISHPPLECVFTTMEEVGMLGAIALAKDVITARRMIGLDGGGEVGTCVSSAGGVKVVVKKNVNYERNCNSCCKITIGGLLGGHSGLMIDKGHANADKLGFRILFNLYQRDPNLRIVSLAGGLKDNGIPREFECIVSHTMEFAAIENYIRAMAKDISNEYSESDPGLYISVERTEILNDAVTVADTATIIKLGYLIPDGVISMSQKLKIPTASLNMGLCKLEGNSMKYKLSIRSPYESMKASLIEKIVLISEIFDAYTNTEGDYPGWAFSETSPLLETIKEMFKEKGKDFFVGAVHGGLEAGIWKGRYPEMDIITYGPILFDCHTPQERLDIASFKRTYDNLIELLKRV